MALALCISCANDSKPADNEFGKPEKTANTQQTSQPAVTSNNSSIVSNINLPDGAAPAAPAKRPPEPAQNADGVWHYTCVKGCPGGGAAATKCATCGELLKHNTAYHAKAPGQPNIAAPNALGQPGTSPIQLNQPTQKPIEPAQNAAGVWHFTCAKGCAGGAGAKGPCGVCGGTLAHNQAYH